MLHYGGFNNKAPVCLFRFTALLIVISFVFIIIGIPLMATATWNPDSWFYKFDAGQRSAGPIFFSIGALGMVTGIALCCKYNRRKATDSGRTAYAQEQTMPQGATLEYQYNGQSSPPQFPGNQGSKDTQGPQQPMGQQGITPYPPSQQPGPFVTGSYPIVPRYGAGSYPSAPPAQYNVAPANYGTVPSQHSGDVGPSQDGCPPPPSYAETIDQSKHGY